MLVLKLSGIQIFLSIEISIDRSIVRFNLYVYCIGICYMDTTELTIKENVIEIRNGGYLTIFKILDLFSAILSISFGSSVSMLVPIFIKVIRIYNRSVFKWLHCSQICINGQKDAIQY